MIHAQALRLANQILTPLSVHCERIEIAGSLRRQARDLKDIELVCLASMSEAIKRDMFMKEIGREQFNHTFDALEYIMIETGWVIGDKDGPAYKQLVHPQTSIKLDLFTVYEKRRWGAAFLIRTGPYKFNIELMNYINRHGQHVHNNLLHNHAKLWEKTDKGWKGIPCEKDDECPLIIDTSTEQAFFEAIGLPQVSPDLRSEEWLKKAVSQNIRDKARVRDQS